MTTKEFKNHGWTKVLSRRKDNTVKTNSKSKLARVLGLADLTFIGIGATLGLGVYVLAGSVANKTAGPGVIISFFIAAISSGLAGICYAEFASRVPKAGSAYTYSYVTVGEFCAFFIGWNLILEYAIGTASVAKGLSLYVDGMAGNVMNTTLRQLFPMNVSFLSPYPDFLAAGLVLILTALLAWGVKESSWVNAIFTSINLITVICVVVFGSFKATPSNWNISKEYAINKGYTSEQVGEGGFIPFGWAGIMAGAAKCFYGFVGFDAIATTGEEAKNAKRNIPLSIVLSLILIFFSYFGVATVLTMMVPYYEQDINTPLTTAFDKVNMHYLQYLIRFGAISALSASLLGAMFPLPRILYAMSEDGLLFRFFAEINIRTKTPIIGTTFSGVLAALISGMFDLEQLMDMMSIGTLLAYTIVTICILLLRFKSRKEYVKSSNEIPVNERNSNKQCVSEHFLHKLARIFNLVGSKYTSRDSYTVAKMSIYLFCVITTLLCFVINYVPETVYCTRIIFIAFLIVLDTISFVILARQPQNIEEITFKVPLVPLIPCCSILMNIYLMVKLDKATWIRFIGWVLIGFIIYFFYSIPNSVEGKKEKSESEVNGTGLDESKI